MNKVSTHINLVAPAPSVNALSVYATRYVCLEILIIPLFGRQIQGRDIAYLPANDDGDSEGVGAFCIHTIYTARTRAAVRLPLQRYFVNYNFICMSVESAALFFPVPNTGKRVVTKPFSNKCAENNADGKILHHGKWAPFHTMR